VCLSPLDLTADDLFVCLSAVYLFVFVCLSVCLPACICPLSALSLSLPFLVLLLYLIKLLFLSKKKKKKKKKGGLVGDTSSVAASVLLHDYE